MSNLVIVAIPDENDRVWKVSSEKIPHLTLLFLGDVDAVSNVEQIVQFVEHAANTTLKRFHLPVDRRGELGDDKADVLFFKKSRYDYKAVHDFRSQLLKDDNIKTAYDATTQFEGPWNPHLTLGYPASPAKPETDDWGSFYGVEFNKIAVWLGDFDGPEFLLKDYWDEFEALDAVPLDVAMSGILRDGVDEYEQNLDMGAAFLAHHGVKGMKWGVRKEETPGGGHIRISNRNNAAGLSNQNTTALVGAAVLVPYAVPALFLSKRFRGEVKASRAQNRKVQGDKKYKRAIEKSKRAAEVHNTAADEVNPKISTFNNDKRWKDVDLTKNPVKQHEYDTAVEKELLNPAYARAAVKVYGSESPSGRYKFEIHDHESGTLKFRDTLKEAKEARDAEHAAGDDEEIAVDFVIKRNSTGHIVGFAFDDKEAAMAQSAIEFLEHHGVKGMHWGVRREDVSNAANSGTSALAKKVSEVDKFARDVRFESKTQPRTDEHGGQADSPAKDAVVDAAHKPFKNDLSAINSKPEYVKAKKFTNRLLKPFDPTTKAYRKEVKQAYIDRLETEANKMKNASGTREYTIRERGGDLPKSKWAWEVSTREARHAAGDNFVLVNVITDEDGFVTGTKTVSNEDTMAQSMELGAEFIMSLGISDADLEHYGVKGMRWGVVKPPPSAVNAMATSHVPHGKKRKTQIKVEGGENHPAHEDAVKVAEARAKLNKSGTAALSNNELQDVARRLQLETQVAQLTSNRASKFINRQLEQQGQQAVQYGARKGAKHLVKKAGKAAATTAVTVALL